MATKKPGTPKPARKTVSKEVAQPAAAPKLPLTSSSALSDTVFYGLANLIQGRMRICTNRENGTLEKIKAAPAGPTLKLMNELQRVETLTVAWAQAHATMQHAQAVREQTQVLKKIAAHFGCDQ